MEFLLDILKNSRRIDLPNLTLWDTSMKRLVIHCPAVQSTSEQGKFPLRFWCFILQHESIVKKSHLSDGGIKSSRPNRQATRKDNTDDMRTKEK